MKSVVIYSSISGNTEKIAHCIADELSCQAIDLNKSNINDIDLEGIDIVFIGSGVYAGRLHKNIIRFINNFSNQNVKAIVFFATWFGRGKSIETAINNCKNILLNKNYNVLNEYFECYGNGFKFIRKNHPNEKEYAKARVWAKHIVKIME